MELRELQYFVTIVENASFTIAAEMLHITQPTLSATIKKLEDRISLRLLDRGARDIRLTNEGTIVYQEAKKLLNHYDHVLEEVERLRVQGPPEIAVGMIESAKYWLPDVLAAFKQQHPDVHLKIYDILSMHNVEKSLMNFDIHLAVTNQYLDHPEIQADPIYEEDLVALIPHTFDVPNDDHVTIHDLKDTPFIVCKEGYQTRADILNAFRKAGIKPDLQFEIERFETACSLVEKGLGMTVVPKNYVTYTDEQHFFIKPIKHSHLSRMVYVATNSNRYLPPIVQELIAQVKRHF
ncbi:LysR family transcriptional regulator [Lentibacillus halophilus]|uniref:LysR family transcriptional regulator n=1 Tax=Lentibacillus halophilus TaxID=295065 RepID=A0ABP3J2K5_9BACI